MQDCAQLLELGADGLPMLAVASAGGKGATA